MSRFWLIHFHCRPFCDGCQMPGWGVRFLSDSSASPLGLFVIAAISLSLRYTCMSASEFFSLVMRCSEMIGLTYFSQPILSSWDVLNMSYRMYVLLSRRESTALFSPNLNSTIKIKENIKLIDTMTSSLPDYYINNLQTGSIILGNLDLVGWVIIKKSYDGEHYLLETNQQYS